MKPFHRLKQRNFIDLIPVIGNYYNFYLLQRCSEILFPKEMTTNHIWNYFIYKYELISGKLYYFEEKNALSNCIQMINFVFLGICFSKWFFYVGLLNSIGGLCNHIKVNAIKRYIQHYRDTFDVNANISVNDIDASKEEI